MTSPDSLAWTNVAAGSYNLSVRATDNLGAVTASTAISVSVTNNPVTAVTLQHPIWTGTNFVFSSATDAGRTYEADYTDVLGGGTWNLLGTRTGNGSVISVTNKNASATQRLYRVRTQ